MTTGLHDVSQTIPRGGKGAEGLSFAQFWTVGASVQDHPGVVQIPAVQQPPCSGCSGDNAGGPYITEISSLGNLLLLSGEGAGEKSLQLISRYGNKLGNFAPIFSEGTGLTSAHA